MTLHHKKWMALPNVSIKRPDCSFCAKGINSCTLRLSTDCVVRCTSDICDLAQAGSSFGSSGSGSFVSLSLRPAAVSSFAAPVCTKTGSGLSRSWVTACYKQRGVPTVLTEATCQTESIVRAVVGHGFGKTGSATNHSAAVGNDGLSSRE